MMEEITLDSGIKDLPLRTDYFKSDQGSNTCIIFVAGSGSTRIYERPFIAELFSQTGLSCVSFSYTGSEEGREVNKEQQFLDLDLVTSYVINDLKIDNIILVCTSMGACPTTKLLEKGKYKNNISIAIYMDPADYYLDETGSFKTWSGNAQYVAEKAIFAPMLSNIQGEAKVNVVFYSLRNCINNQYYPGGNVSLGVDREDGHTRMNRHMVKAFFDNLPEINKGAYMELPNVPHAYLRDGDTVKNQKEIAKVIKNLISK